MCGIVAVLTKPPGREPLPVRHVVAALELAAGTLPAGVKAEHFTRDIARAAEHVEEADRMLRGVPGLWSLAGDPGSAAKADSFAAELERRLDALERELDTSAPEDVEEANVAVVRLRDALWAVRRDRIGQAKAALELAGPNPTASALAAWWSVQVALSAIDRLEVRGRDSAGVHLLVSGHGVDPAAPDVRSEIESRNDPLFRSGSVRLAGESLAFVYKAAAEIGELGDNTAALRAQLTEDALLRRAISAPGSRVAVLGHTRWASVGLISEPNAHPLSAQQDGRYMAAALNGDVDNYADLKAAADLDVPPEITTDAAVIPYLAARRAIEGRSTEDAFRETVAEFKGSVAIAFTSGAEPDRLYFALRGSGQALYVGLGPDAYVVASEPYGLVEQAASYVRMDGETPSPSGTRGQVVVLEGAKAGSADGVRRLSYDGTELGAGDPVSPGITTRDVDRGVHRHYLIKEITQAPRSVAKTLRGKLGDDGRVRLGDDTVPDSLRARIARGDIRRIVGIGQGTAAIAARAFAMAAAPLAERGVVIEFAAATELSGFGMRPDMSDTLVVAVSQSGTTADTLRTVEVAKGRGASLISIVNRRNSDLCDRSDGVLYTSDGRDVEMAVPSTKAFYAQVAAGILLATALCEAAGIAYDQSLLVGLRELPAAMERVLELREEIAGTARRHVPFRRSWAVVGNGANRIAAEEVRIKLSELCYKSISCDLTEDKKHIDLSAEPLILVCAAGLSDSNAEDVAKEIAIYRAHKAAPIVIASEGEVFRTALDVITVPVVHPQLDFVLSAMAGHLFGYEAALVIDGQARCLREARAVIETAASGLGGAPAAVARALASPAQRFYYGLRAGEYDGHLPGSQAARLASLFRYATGVVPLDAYQVEYGKVGTPGTVLEDLADALTRSIDELTRPVDAIRHQAKTVTVGISRAEETLLQTTLVREVLAAGVGRDMLSYRTLRTLAALDPAVEAVTGYTHYRIEGDIGSDRATVAVTDRGGIALEISSRTASDPALKGTKHRVAMERQVLVTRGRRDGRTIIIVPEVKGVDTTGLALLHVRFADRLAPAEMRGVLQGYRERYGAIHDLVLETEPTFREDLLGEIPVDALLIDSVQALADHWRAVA